MPDFTDAEDPSSRSVRGVADRRRFARPRGSDFDLKSWHMGALSLGSLGLDDLADELSGL
jgi:hypothetical protein